MNENVENTSPAVQSPEAEVVFVQTENEVGGVEVKPEGEVVEVITAPV